MRRLATQKIQHASLIGKSAKLLVAIGFAVSVAACQEYQKPSDLLFAPTPDNGRGNIPVTYGTKYDCRTFQGSGWKGIAGGRVSHFDESFPVSRAGCFPTENECQTFLMLMSGYITYNPYLKCQPYNS